MSENQAYRVLSARAAGTNVSPVTLLATDYFNHFNEVIMLIGMISDMPEIIEDAREWRPISYVEHFEASSIADRELAIEAYPHVPERFKQPFETTIQQINVLVEDALDSIGKRLAEGNAELVREVVDNFSRALQRLVDVASAIVHGGENVMNQSEIDNLINE